VEPPSPQLPQPRPAEPGLAGAAPAGEGTADDGVFIFPASYAQRRLWFLDRLQPGSPAYNLFNAVRLSGRLRPAMLAATLAAIVERHEALRTTFATLDGEPVQVIAPRASARLPRVDLAALPPAAREAELSRLALGEALRPFDLAHGPLLRCTLVRLAADEHAALWNLHHIAGDAWSMGVLMREVGALYGAFCRGEPGPLPPLAVQYADFSQAQRDWLGQGGKLDALLAFWRRTLAGLQPLEVPGDRPRPAGRRGTRAGATSRQLGRQLHAACARLARQQGTTLFVTLLAGLDALLQRYTGSDDLAVGSVVAGRETLAAEEMVGFFANVLVLRVELAGAAGFAELLRRTHAAAIAAFAHQAVPFEMLVNELAPRRDLARSPLVDVMLTLQNTPPRSLELPGLTLSPGPPPPPSAKFDWTLTVADLGGGGEGGNGGGGDGGLGAALEYSADLFDHATAARALAAWESLLAAAAGNPEAPLGELPLLAPAERHQLVVEALPEAIGAAPCLHQLFESWVARTPDAPALTVAGRTLTYAELDGQAARLARRLRLLGVGPEVPVGLRLGRGGHLVTAILGVLKAGGAYVPLEPSLPAGRLRAALEDSGARLLLTSAAEEAPAAAAPGPAVTVVLVEEALGAPPGEGWPPAAPSAAPGGGATAAPWPPVSAMNLAYVIFTSGSTGQPKGVAVAHGCVTRLLAAAQRRFGFGAAEVWTLFHSYAFDFAVWELWGALAFGGRLVEVPWLVSRSPQALAELLARERVTVLNQTPSAFYQLLAAEAELGRPVGPDLSWVILGGEAVEPSRLAPWFERHGDERPRLVNMYGITETTVHVTFRRLRQGEVPRLGSPAGGPLADLSVYVLDAAGQPTPLGVFGELYVGGAGLARGYLGRPELTAERFLPDPWSGAAGARLYRSGDRGRWQPGGELELAGRIDRQLKLRGFRIEPGEVEAALVSHPAVAAAAVALREDVPGEPRLVAWLAARQREVEVEVATLRRFLAERLPEHMVPAVFVWLDALPLTVNGKLDRGALPAPERTRPELSSAFSPPRSAAEHALAEIWAEVLGLERVGVEDSFFALGGDSILSLRMLGLAARRGLRLSLAEVFRHPTIAGLLAATAATANATAAPAAVAERPIPPFALLAEADRRRLPPGIEDAYPLSFLQAGLLFHSEYESGSSTYQVFRSLELAGTLDLRLLRAAVAAAAARHPALRTSFDLASYGEPLQLVRRSIATPFAVVDLRRLPASRLNEATARAVAWERRRNFRPEDVPLWRVTVMPLAPGRCRLSLGEHHAILDGWSVALLLAELFATYVSLSAAAVPATALPPTAPPTAPPAASFADFVAHERQAVESAEQRAFWTGLMRDREATLLPRFAAAGRRRRRSGQAELAVPIARETGAALLAAARQAGVPRKSLLLAIHLRVLALCAGRPEVTTGLALNGRPEVDGGDRLLGLFLNAVPLPRRLPAGSWLDLSRDAYAAESELLAFRLFPVAELRRILGGRPLYEAVFNYVHYHALDPVARSRTIAVAGGEGAAEHSFTFLAHFSAAAGDDLPLLNLSFDSARLGMAEARALAGWYERALAACAADPDAAWQAAPLLTPAELHQVRIEHNDTAAVFPRQPGLAELFSAQAARRPDDPAIRFADGRLGYAELAAAAANLARRLAARGVGRGSAVGIALEGSAAAVVASVAVILAGGFYVPLDPALPAERLAWLLADSGVRVVLGGPRRWPPPPALAAAAAAGDIELVAVELPAAGAVPADTRAPMSASRAAVRSAGGDDTAYLIYTSGSTGRPKGVAVPQRAVSRLVLGGGFVRLGPGERLAQAASISFDAATFEIWGALLTGAEVIGLPRDVTLAPRRLAAAIAGEAVTVLFLTTALFNQVAREAPDAFRPLSCLLFGGEAVDPRQVLRVLEAGPPARLLHVYGPTESTTFATWYHVVEVAPEQTTVPIGRPLGATSAHVLDPLHHPLPLGVPGELALGGDGLAQGYHRRPDLTAERFIPDPASVHPGARLYRTGDSVRRLPDGSLEFLGRLDRQAKLRGFRIEPGEIEAAICRQPGAQAAVVIVAEVEPGDRRLVAYVEADPAAPVDLAELRRRLAASLPDYMVPAAFVPLARLPLDGNGKIDRRALPAVAWERPAGTAYRAPRTALEGVVAAVWEQVLRVPRAGVDDDFFALGGHSLLATEVVSRLRRALAVELPVRCLFEAPTIAELAPEIERRMGFERGFEPPPLVRLERPPGEARLPLSFAQQRLWLLDQLAPGGAEYNIPLAIALGGRLSVPALAASLAALAARHETLATTFGQVHGEPFQRLPASRQPAPALPVVDLGALADRAWPEARRRAQQEAARPFDLERGPVWRALLVRLDGHRHLLVLTIHHIAADGWSMDVLQRELAELYVAHAAGRAAVLPELPVRYADYAQWQRRWLRGMALAGEIAWWRQRLAGLPAVLPLPADRPRPPVESHRGARRPVTVEPALAAALVSLGRRQGATLFMVLLAAFDAVLSQATGEPRLAVGTPIAGRTQVDLYELIGFFVNTLVLAADLGGNPPFVELLAQVRETALEAHAHQDLPFEKLVEELEPARSLAHSPLFQVMFALQNLSRTALTVAGLTLERADVGAPAAKFDLTLALGETGAGMAGGLAGALEYAADLFDPATMERLRGRLLALLAAVAERPEARLADLAVLPAAERHQLLVEWNEWGEAPAPPSSIACLHELLAAQAARTPGAPAVECGGEQLSYRDLDRLAARLACRLRAAGVGPEATVAVLMDRSLELVVALAGILAAGGAYVPLDPAWPRERLELMLADCGAAVLLTQEWLADRLDAAGRTVICLDASWEGLDAAGGEERGGSGPAADPRQLAYVIYTSGSTGRPKGVAVTHASAAALLAWAAAAFSAAEVERVLAATSICFDLSVFEIFMPLSRGGTVVLVDSVLDLLTLTGEAVTLIDTVPSAVAELVGVAGLPPTVRTVNLAGEPIPPGLVAQIHAQPGVSRLLNLYGPTESTVYATWAEVAPGDTAAVIGRPIPGTRAVVLDAAGSPVPLGVAGELCVGGRGLARGYFRAPAATAERFLPDPEAARRGEPGARLYRTGDVVRHLPDGRLHFLGRADDQVKVRGFRIELGEVAAALAAHPGVRQAAVVARGETSGERRLVAYVVADAAAGGGPPAAAELRGFLRDRLPDYMVPAAFVPLPAIPLTPNGKLDRRALPEPERAAAVAPRDLQELALARLWEEILDVRPVGVSDDFFELGGHSLLAVRLMVRIRERFRRELPLASLFRARTIENLAALLRREGEAPSGSALVEITPAAVAAGSDGGDGGDGGEQRRPFVCVHPAGGNVLCYADLARALGPRQPFYGLQYPAAGPRLDGGGGAVPGEPSQRPPETIEELAAHYIAALHAAGLHGPHRLGGWSLGGAVAFEMARQLAAAGETIELLAMLDAAPPGAATGWDEEELELMAWFARDLAALSGRQVTVSRADLDGVPAGDRLRQVVLAAQAAHVLPPDLGPAEAARLFEVFRTTQRALRAYVPGRYEGPVLLVLAGAPPMAEEEPPAVVTTWRRYAAAVEVEWVPGDHYSLVRPPQVDHLARLIAARLPC
jgi:amino acid adenylation domain-containing protein